MVKALLEAKALKTSEENGLVVDKLRILFDRVDCLGAMGEKSSAPTTLAEPHQSRRNGTTYWSSSSEMPSSKKAWRPGMILLLLFFACWASSSVSRLVIDERVSSKQR